MTQTLPVSVSFTLTSSLRINLRKVNGLMRTPLWPSHITHRKPVWPVSCHISVSEKLLEESWGRAVCPFRASVETLKTHSRVMKHKHPYSLKTMGCLRSVCWLLSTALWCYCSREVTCCYYVTSHPNKFRLRPSTVLSCSVFITISCFSWLNIPNTQSFSPSCQPPVSFACSPSSVYFQCSAETSWADAEDSPWFILDPNTTGTQDLRRKLFDMDHISAPHSDPDHQTTRAEFDLILFDQSHICPRVKSSKTSRLCLS